MNACSLIGITFYNVGQSDGNVDHVSLKLRYTETFSSVHSHNVGPPKSHTQRRCDKIKVHTHTLVECEITRSRLSNYKYVNYRMAVLFGTRSNGIIYAQQHRFLTDRNRTHALHLDWRILYLLNTILRSNCNVLLCRRRGNIIREHSREIDSYSIDSADYSIIYY